MEGLEPIPIGEGYIKRFEKGSLKADEIFSKTERNNEINNERWLKALAELEKELAKPISERDSERITLLEKDLKGMEENSSNLRKLKREVEENKNVLEDEINKKKQRIAEKGF